VENQNDQIGNIPTTSPRQVVTTGTLLRNTALNVGGRFFTMICTFILTPIILESLGAEAFGLWAISFAFVSTAYLADLGMFSAVQKYAAACFVDGHEARIPRLSTLAALLPFGFWGFVALILGLTQSTLVASLGIALPLRDAAGVLLWTTPLLIGLNAAMWCQDAAISGMRRMDVTNIVRVASAVVNVAGILLVLRLGYGIEGLMCAIAVSTLVAVLALAVAMRMLTRHTQPDSSESSIAIVRQLMQLGIKVQGTNLLLMASAQMDKLVLSGVVGLSAVTYYELGSRLLGVAQTIPMMLISAIPMAASEFWARGDIEGLRRLYIRGSRWLSAVYIPLFGILIVLAPIITSFWVGPGYADSVESTRLLSLGGALNLTTGMGTTIGRGIGIPGYETIFVAVSTLARLPLSIIMGQNFGFGGVLVSNLITMFIGVSLFLVLFHRRLNIPWSMLGGPILLRPVVATFVASGILYLTSIQFTGVWQDLNRWQLVPHLIKDGVIFLCVYGVVLLALGHFSREERQSILKRCERFIPVAFLSRNQDKSEQTEYQRRAS
jgi:O-antigen/teichoic acid export membrane protein